MRTPGVAARIAALGADGVEFPVEIAITPVAGEPTPLFTASIRDVSRRDVEERVAERTGELLRKISEHEALLQEVHRRLGDNLNVISSLIDMQTLQVRDAAGPARARAVPRPRRRDRADPRASPKREGHLARAVLRLRA